MTDKHESPLSPHLGLWGCISIIVGIVVGVSIFRVPSLVFSNVQYPWQGLAAWVAGGILALIGALCYAELATTYPHMGGDYAYLTKAFHPYIGYLFGWSRLAVIQTASIGALAYVLADYAISMFPDAGFHPAAIASVSVASLTFINILGVRFGKFTQNMLTLLKAAGLLGIIICGWRLGSGDAFQVTRDMRGPGIGLAMIFILYAYGGWNEAAFVSAEMRNRKRNIPLALILSISAITAIYFATNLAYLMALGFEGVRDSAAPAADVLKYTLGEFGMKAISLAVIISVLGALNGTILTGSRVYAAMGPDHKVFAMLGRWSPRLGTPIWSFLAQGLITLIMIMAVGTGAGRAAMDSFLMLFGLEGLPWDSYGGGFGTLVAASAPIFWFFILLTGISVIVLRIKDRQVERAFRLPFYPLLPILFCVTCIYMLHSSYTYAEGLSLLGLIPAVAGIPLYIIGK